MVIELWVRVRHKVLVEAVQAAGEAQETRF
jgi:hypothetical protein